MEKLINGVLLTRETVVEAHGGLVHKECHKLKAWAKLLGHEYEDIQSVGFIGLINAFDRFDSGEYDVRFSTFAVPQIWGAIQNFLNSNNQGVYYPAYIKDVGRKIRERDIEDLPVNVIAKEINETASKVEYALNYLKNGRPTHLEIELEGSERKLSDSIGAPDDKTEIHVKEFLKTLTAMEQEVTTQLMIGIQASEIARIRGCVPSNVGYVRKRVREKYIEYSNL